MCTHSLVPRREIIARVQLAVRVAVPDAKHALVLVWVIIHVDHDGGLGLGDLPTRDELATAREELGARYRPRRVGSFSGGDKTDNSGA